MRKELGKEVHPETIRVILRKAKFHGRVARRKPFINKINKRKRREFAEEHVNKDLEWWNRVIFSDESKFNVFGPDGRTLVWRQANTQLQEKNLQPTVKHGGGNVMVWGCMAASGVGELVFIEDIMDKHKYLNVLKDNLKKSADKLGIGHNFSFYQDNDPKHTSQLVQLWLLYNCPKVLHPPPNPQTSIP